jgi:hypothetical protein
MKAFALILLAGSLAGLVEHTMAAPKQTLSPEAQLSEWLAFPGEFGKKPASTREVAAITVKIGGLDAPALVHVVEFRMPDGAYGKGFVSSDSYTWSFGSRLPYDRLTDEQLVIAYAGWSWLFPAVHSKAAATEFQPATLKRFLANLAEKGLTDIAVGNKYKIQDAEIFEFRATRSGIPVVGAGSEESELIVGEATPQASLSMVYWYLGMYMNDKL